MMSNFSTVVLTSHSDPKVRSHYYQKLKLLNTLKTFIFYEAHSHHLGLGLQGACAADNTPLCFYLLTNNTSL